MKHPKICTAVFKFVKCIIKALTANVSLDGNVIFEPWFALGADTWNTNIVPRVLVFLFTAKCESEVYEL